MDLTTYIKKEEPVEFVLTADDQGKAKEQSNSNGIMVTVWPFLKIIVIYDFWTF